MEVLSTIVPIFAVVLLGCFARSKGFVPQEFLGPANRLVYYLAIPALLFRAVSKASFRTDFNAIVLLVTLASATIAYLSAWLLGRKACRQPGRVGTFIQCSAHGNHGYIGLPIAYYYLGDAGLVKASILAGFLMILQNVFSVLALQTYSTARSGPEKRLRSIVQQLVRNPVILSALAGVLFSLYQVPIPTPVVRFLDILGGLAPPMSLLLIGASLSFAVLRKSLVPLVTTVAIKIVALPALGLALFLAFGVTPVNYLPALILLATPTATVAYVMSREMGGDSDFAVAAVSTSTILSAVTYSIWLTVRFAG